MAIEKRINLAIQPHHRLPPIWGDETHLQQIVGNLVSNALTYTPQNGTVRIWSEAAEESVIVRVQDSGIGISPGDIPHIFDPFFRAGVAKEVNSEGTGLGLAIVKRIVEEHGGSVGVESAPGIGSTFWFRLPTVAHDISAI
jgi:signal transduction histidine kinase